jgi:hypothetical protein
MTTTTLAPALKIKTAIKERRRILFFFKAMDRAFAHEIRTIIETPQRGRPRRSYPAGLYYAARLRLMIPIA